MATLLACLPLSPAEGQAAVDRYQTLPRMHHTAWTARDGLAGNPSSLAQTTDGFLWIGTSDGLFRFDGITLEPYRPAVGVMAARAVSALAAAPAGGLWVGHTSGGVTFIDGNGQATTYSDADSLPVARIRSIAVDLDGTVWVAAVGGLARFNGKQWQKVRADWGYPNRSAWSLYVDPQGTLWVGAASPNGVRFLSRGARRFVDLGMSGSSLGFGQLDDSTIVYAHQSDPTVHLVRRRGDSAEMVQTIPGLPSSSMTIDRDGGVWVGGSGLSRFRLTGPPGVVPMAVSPIERFTRDDGVSGEVAAKVVVDREGTVWVVTESGLDRFRRRNLLWDRDTTLIPGASVLTGVDGRVWILSYRAPTLRDGSDLMPVKDAPRPLDNGFVDRDGAVWFSNLRELFRWDGTAFTTIPPPKQVVDSQLPFTVTGTVRDARGRLWVTVSGSGVFVREDTSWIFKPILDGRPDMSPASISADGQGGVWLLYRNELAAVDGDRVRIYTAADGLELGSLTSVRATAGRVWVTGERGIALLAGDRFNPVRTSVGDGLGVVTGTVLTRDGLWFTSTTGIGQIHRSELERLYASPATPVRVELFDLVSDLPDPLRLVARAFSWSTEGGDGVLWFVTKHGIAKVDPRQVVRNPLPPPVAFRSVIADDSSFSPQGEIRLPPLTRTLRIGYSGLSLVIPERVQFRHRLEGWEDDWHEADNRREVTYTDLRPGRYALQVMASNNDGVWNETGSTLRFSVAPAWFQTTLFRVFVGTLLIAAGVFVYRMRIRRVSAALAARHDERLAERTRIARELHDTLLQTVQGSKMVADDALDRPDDVERLRHAMGRVSEWLGQAAEEGRAALNSLRVSTADRDLADALRRAADDPARPPTLTVSVETRGAPRALHPVIQEEIYRIGHESIHNAYLHSGASRLTIELEYGHDLILKMTDNGVGLDPAVADNGKPGRFGIRGMRERATSIGGTLAVEPANPGTRVTVVVPGRRIFAATGSAD